MTESNNPNKISKNYKGDELRPPKKPATDTCNAWAKIKYCANKAGFGTTHVGNGRCKYHGGASAGPPKKLFSASKYLNIDLLNTIEDISDIDPETMIKLDNEINLIRTGLFKYAKECSDKKENMHASTIKEFIGILIKAIETKAKLEGKISKKIPMEIIVLYVNQVTGILKQECPPEQLQRISARMKGIQLEGLDGSGSEQNN